MHGAGENVPSCETVLASTVVEPVMAKHNDKTMHSIKIFENDLTLK
jgi:hypothetical protein